MERSPNQNRSLDFATGYVTDLDTDAVIGALTTALREIEAFEEGLPHVLICTDAHLGGQTFSGPFWSRAACEQIRRHEIEAAGHDTTLRFAIAPLYPALQLVNAREPGAVGPRQAHRA